MPAAKVKEPEPEPEIIDLLKCEDGVFRAPSELPANFVFDWELRESMRNLGYRE